MVVHVYYLFLVLVTKVSPGVAVPLLTPQCDSSSDTLAIEGALGETKNFPWLGILRVHLHEHGSLKVALTGIVLVKEGYAIAFADDIARISKRVIQSDSKAMFIPKDQEPWYCTVKDYMTHPEYEYRTMSTIALLELDPGDAKIFPMMPICWSSYNFNTANQLYAVGYTDENKLLEKSFHKMVYVEETLCKEFYNRAGMAKDNKMEPTHIQCGFAANNNENCVWDNGMALISNASSRWTLIGLGLHGPGCAAPARFIDLLTYYEWIESASDLQEIDDLDDTRKSFKGASFKPKFWNTDDFQQEDMNQMSSKLSTEGAVVTNPSKRSLAQYYPYPFNVTGVTPRQFTIHRETATTISIHRNFSGQIGSCLMPRNVLLYKDEIKVLAITHFTKSNAKGIVRYKISMNDLNALNYTCVIIKVHSLHPESTYLNYSTEMTTYGNPVALIKHLLQLTPSRFNITKQSGTSDKLLKDNFNNINILLEINFVYEATLEIIVYGDNGTVTELKLKNLFKNNKPIILPRKGLKMKSKHIDATTKYVNQSFINHSLPFMENILRNEIISWTRQMLPNLIVLKTKSDGETLQTNITSKAISGRPKHIPALDTPGSESTFESTTAVKLNPSNVKDLNNVVFTTNETFKTKVITTEDLLKPTGIIKLSAIENGTSILILPPKSLARYNLQKNGPIIDEPDIVSNSERNRAHSFVYVVMQLFLRILFAKMI